MSDIVEMLVDAAGGNEAHVCAIAAAEIKRNLSQIEQLDARCGRLRDTCSTWERASNNYAEAVEIKNTEIERLRGELSALQTHFDIKAKLGDEKDAEIERLRILLAEPLSLYKMDFDEYAKWLNDWEKRVREALGDG